MMERTERILVTGAPRSGTTWLGQLLCARARTRHFHEPFNPAFPPPGCRFRARHHFERISIPRDEARVEMLEHLLRGRVQIPSVCVGDLRHPRRLAARLLRTLRMKLEPRPSRVVLKDPLAALSCDILRKRLDMQGIVLVRAPESVVASFISRNWNFRPLHFRRQPEIWDGLLDQDERMHLDQYEHLPGREGVLLRVAWMWRCTNRILQRFSENDPSWTVVRHESFLEHGDDMAESLFGRLGLDFGEPERRFLRESQSEDHAHNSVKPRPVLEVQASISELRTATGRRISSTEIDIVRDICSDTNAAWATRILEPRSRPS